jgi:hypothetical protein
MLARALKWLTISLFALVLLYLAVLAYARLTTPTAAQREAIAVLEARMPAVTGEGVAMLHYARRLDVAEADIGAAFAREIAAARAGEDPASPADPARTLPDLVLRCRGAGCLALVREEPAFADAIAAWAPVRERVAKALASDSLASRNEGGLVPAVQVLRVGESAHALAFDRGDRAAAIDALCVDLGHLRRHAHASSSNVVLAMVYPDGFARHAELLAVALAEAPELALPASCAALVAVPPEPLSAPFCDAMAGELAFFREFQGALARARAGQGGFDRAAGALFDDREAAEGFLALRYAAFCSPAAEAVLRADDPAAFAGPGEIYRLVDRVGLWLVAEDTTMADGLYLRYFQRAADHVAMQRLLAARLLLHGGDPAVPLAERIAALPAWVHSPTRRIEAGADGQSIQVVLRGGDPGDIARMPLPAPAPVAPAVDVVPAAAAPDAAP